MEFSIKGGSPNANIFIDNQVEKDGIFTFDVNLRFDEPEIPEQFSVMFDFASIDVYSIWSPSVRYDRFVGVTWQKKVSPSRLAAWMPLHALVSANGRNRLTIAISDAKTPTAIASGVHEHSAMFECELRFFTIKVAPLKEYKATVRLDLRDIPYYDSIYAVSEWWENECGYKPAYVPEYAKLPMNSLWYSYHQELFADELLAECVLSKPLGMDTVIVDDGWQTHDQGRGYVTCGDWQMAPNKFPDMRKFVEDVHAIGMKVMLWFSVPFIGIEAKQFERFKDMMLAESKGSKKVWVFDPRYKEVRDYLIEIYANAVKEWNLDGLKLDFIDNFVLEGKGLEVIDLGTDVAAETFIQTAIEQDCRVICCSALLTTTMPVMAEVVKLAEAKGIRDKVKIMVGGAPVSQEYCNKIGADCYTVDAASAADAAVEFCKAQ